MNFYYVDNEKHRVGPISFEELRSRHITESTYVWFAGMGPAWKPAGQVPELAELFQTTEVVSRPDIQPVKQANPSEQEQDALCYCDQCGKALSPQMAYCPYCGAKIGVSLYDRPASPQQATTLSIPEPDAQPAIEPVQELVAQHVIEAAPEPVAQPAIEPVQEPVAQPAIDSVPEPVAQPAIEAVPEPVAQPVIEPVTEPLAQPVSDLVTESVAPPIVKPGPMNEAPRNNGKSWLWAILAVVVVLLGCAAAWWFMSSSWKGVSYVSYSPELEQIALDGDTAAQMCLSKYYAEGDGVVKDESVAARWLRAAAEQGHARAQFELGRCYVDGRGVVPDTVEAVKWTRAAAEQGLPSAQYNLAVMYYSGLGVEQSDQQAVAWYAKAAEQNHGNAQARLGECYLNGWGVAVDRTQAFKWFVQAERHGVSLDEIITDTQLRAEFDQFKQMQPL